ncbi:HNH endonuclease signature motif containing protein [Limnoraphis robusta Tam1]|uniref:HNH endonuclease signature motif containing protein n=1 Tax=Limnoraphis robusta TaxID=1118279 RepID=UPI002B21C88E|nr:HNH endonuclease signature motif containing protein [Limnoraphis robusta]MEA5539475.1 HNH endonuclease signature motif containing protein [Limnoraphis robusta Tam1]
MTTLHQLIANLLSAMKRTDTSLLALKADVPEIEAKYDAVKLARSEFNSWRDSDDGKTFKKRLYRRQKSQCANPNCQLKARDLPIDYLEIDHKLPITTHHQLALKKSNMQLLCTPCNRKKSSRI